MKKIFVAAILLFTASIHAQAPDTLWTRTYGGLDYDYGESVQQTIDGGYIVAGFTYSYGAGLDDVWLIKTDRNGDTLWTKTYGGPLYDAGFSVQQMPDSGYIVVGIADATSSTGMLYLIKTDSSGDTLWTRKFGGGGREVGYSVQQTFDGGYVATGYTMTFGPGYSAFYLVKTDSFGDTLWIRTFGGSSLDVGKAVQQTTNGGYIIVGYTASYGAGPPCDVWLIRTDSFGDTLWTRTFGGSGWDRGYSVQQTTDGGYIIAGDTWSYGAGFLDIYFIKTAPETGIEEKKFVWSGKGQEIFGPTIISGPLLLPEGKSCRVFDITGRIITLEKIKPGIYFVEIDGVISHKVIKVK